MNGSIVDLTERSQRRQRLVNGHERSILDPIPPLTFPHLHAWNVDLMSRASCCQCQPAAPPVNVRWLIRVDPLRREYEIGVFREGWDPCFVFQERFRPDETPEQAIAREARLRLVNDLLAMSFGVPA